MNDLISRQAAIDLWKRYRPYIAVKASEYDMELKMLPSAQAERKEGHWLKAVEDDRMQIVWCECSECGQPMSWMPRFCPNCGVYMGEIDDD